MIKSCYGIVYCLTSPSNKKYVGQTINWSTRKSFYKNLLCDDQPKIYNALLKYGYVNFKVEILCYVYSKKDLDEMETWYIRYYDSWKNGYNCDEGGGGFGKMDEETAKKIFLAQKLKKDMKNEYIGVQWDKARSCFKYVLNLNSASKVVRGYAFQKEAALGRDFALVKAIENESKCKFYMNFPEIYEDIKQNKIAEPVRIIKRKPRISKYKHVKYEAKNKGWFSTPSLSKNEKRKTYCFKTEREAAIMSDYLNCKKGLGASYLNFPERIEEYKDKNFIPPITSLNKRRTSKHKYITLYAKDNGSEFWSADLRHIDDFQVKRTFRNERDALTWRNAQFAAKNQSPPD